METSDFCVYYLDYLVDLETFQLDLCSRYGMSCDDCCHCIKEVPVLD